MLEIKYFSETGFSTLRTFKGPGGMTMKWGLRDKISVDLMPQLACTCYKFQYPESVYSVFMDSDERDQEQKLIDQLSQLCSEVPIIRAKRFNNACYINNFPEVIKNRHYIEQDLKDMSNSWGMNYQEFRSKLKDHMVILGDRFASAPVLAHELGHYLNTIGKGEPEGQKAHAKYSSAKYIVDWINFIGDLSLTSSPVIMASANNKSIAASTLLINAASHIASIIAAKPILVAEECASLTAMKLLKRLEIKNPYAVKSRIFLDGALNTYLMNYKKLPILITLVDVAGSAILLKPNKNKNN